MAIGLGESRPISDTTNVDAGDFECNICFDLAQDPIITLCGHLYCWPCLYRWLHLHSQSHECPVCKALIEEEKLVPIYGRWNNSTDPQSKSTPEMEIPHRPTGQRPATAPPPPPRDPLAGAFAQQGGFTPVVIAGLWRFVLSTLLGPIPSISITWTHGFPDADVYGLGPGFRYGCSNMFHVDPAYGFPQHVDEQQQADSALKFLMLVIGFGVLLVLTSS